MSTATVDHRRPTPPLISPELDHNLQQLVQHNQGRDATQTHHNQVYGQSAPQGISFGSPEVVMQDPRVAAHYSPQRYAYGQYPDLSDPSAGLGIQFGEQYGAPGTAYYHDGPLTHGLPYGNSSMPVNDPPTPHSVTSDSRRTRSGRSITRTVSPLVRGDRSRSRVSRTSPKPRRSKASKGDKPKTPKLTAPLSELTKDMKIPVRDMDEWVNRSIEVRQQEVEKRKGYVTRPMNSFMLYRSAFADRTKEWCRQNNHQVVSSVSGESWPMEPQEVREKYNELAKLERINHQNAHPHYKFSPSKAGQTKKRKGADSDEEDEDDMSDYDDGDAAWTPSGQRKSRPRPSGRSGRDLGHPNEMMLNDPYGRSFAPSGNTNASSWETANDFYGYQYYQAALHPGAGAIPLQRADTPVMHYQTAPSLLGLPGGQHHDLMNSRSGTPLAYEHQVDPQLLGYGMPTSIAGQDSAIHAIMGPNSQFDEQYGDLELFGGETAPATHNEWALDPDMGSLAADADFGRWEDDFGASN